MRTWRGSEFEACAELIEVIRFRSGRVLDLRMQRSSIRSIRMWL